MDRNFDNGRIVIHTPDPEKQQEPKPSPGELFRQAIGWVVAAVLVLVVPVLIVCRDPIRILAVVGSVLGIAIVYTIVACTGWRD